MHLRSVDNKITPRIVIAVGCLYLGPLVRVDKRSEACEVIVAPGNTQSEPKPVCLIAFESLSGGDPTNRRIQSKGQDWFGRLLWPGCIKRPEPYRCVTDPVVIIVVLDSACGVVPEYRCAVGSSSDVDVIGSSETATRTPG
jgi:hypothetical protein